LRPFVALLPVRTAVNLNTAGAEVLHASIAGLGIAQAKGLVLERTTSHFRSLDDAGRLLGAAATGVTESGHAVASRFFEVQTRLRTGDLVLEERSLLQRNETGIRAVARSRQQGY
jgi:general secretion pathway protein K